MKKLIFSLVLFIGLIQDPAWAMRTPVFGTSSTSPSTSATNYMGFASAPVATNDQGVRSITASAGIAEGLTVNLSTAPTSGKSYTFTFEKNGSDTAITCQVADTNTTCTSNAFVSLAAGDNFSIKIVPAGTPAAPKVSFSVIFNSGSSGGSLIYASADNVGNSTGSTETIGVMGRLSWGQSNTKTFLATAGIISNLYISSKTAPGSAASGKQYVYTILKNAIATSLTCTVFETATTCNDTVGGHSFSVVATDILTITSTPTSTPTSGTTTVSMIFTPTIDGESVFSWTANGSPSNSADTFSMIFGYGGTNATENLFYVPVPLTGAIAKKLYVNASNNPGAAKSFTHNLRVNGADSLLTCSRTGSSSATTCNDTVDQVSLTRADLLDTRWSPSGTPTTSSSSQVAFVIYIDPNDKIYGSTFYGSTNY